MIDDQVTLVECSMIAAKVRFGVLKICNLFAPLHHCSPTANFSLLWTFNLLS